MRVCVSVIIALYVIFSIQELTFMNYEIYIKSCEERKFYILSNEQHNYQKKMSYKATIILLYPSYLLKVITM